MNLTFPSFEYILIIRSTSIPKMTINKTLRGHKLLMVMPWEQPAEFIKNLKAEFPGLQVVTYRQTEWDQTWAPFPDEEWKDVTVLLTFTVLPTPEQAPKLEYVQLMR